MWINTEQPVTMNITLIGAGNLATNLGKALCRAGHRIVQVYSRTMQSAEVLADAVGAEPVADIGGVTAEADIYILSVKDSVLPSLLPPLCKGKEGKLFLHTAGSIGMDVFEGCARSYGVLYPMQTFSKQREVPFADIPFFIEGSDAGALDGARALAASVSDKVYVLASDGRRTLHLAAVFASNFVNHCLAVSSELLSGCGLPFDVMYPLIDEVIAKAHAMPPADAQTGPAVRYDVNVIERHAAMLAAQPMFRKIYEDMSRSIHAMSQNTKI